jgi:hypothetical protein
LWEARAKIREDMTAGIGGDFQQGWAGKWIRIDAKVDKHVEVAGKVGRRTWGAGLLSLAVE